MPAGTHSIELDRVTETVRWPVAGCILNVFQNGDLDVDGTPYRQTGQNGPRAMHGRLHTWPRQTPVAVELRQCDRVEHGAEFGRGRVSLRRRCRYCPNRQCHTVM